jgi:peptidylprolyl isomerase
MPEEMFRVDGLHAIKHFVQTDVFKFLPTLEKVNFIETHVKQQTKSQEKTTKKKTEPKTKTKKAKAP